MCIHIGYDNYGYEVDEYDEYMYIHQLNDQSLCIEFYGKGIFFKLRKNKDILSCYMCNGAGYINYGCSHCDGKGGYYITCDYCNGDSSHECPYCDNGYTYDEYNGQEVCEWCNGTGTLYCDFCGGNIEYYSCYYCYGNGKTEKVCNYCDGEGYVIE